MAAIKSFYILPVDNSVEVEETIYKVPFDAKKESDGTVCCVIGHGCFGRWIDIGGVRVGSGRTVLRERMQEALARDKVKNK